jgi:hypothetical protein
MEEGRSMRGKTTLVLAAVGLGAVALAVTLYRSRQTESEPSREDDLYVAALDGVVGQPRRLLGASLPRPRLRLPGRRTGSEA